MAKITRKTQKVFAGSASQDQITAFGTAKNTNPTYTTDLNAIQTSIYNQGWTPSLMSDLAPYLEDSNGLWYLVTTQLAYLFQQGIAEWDANTEYTKGSIVSTFSGNNLILYMSLANGNIGNSVTNTEYWKRYAIDDKIETNYVDTAVNNLKTTINNGTITGKTQASTDNSTKLSTTAFVNTAVSNLKTTINNGTITGKTQASTDNSTKLATTAFVKNSTSDLANKNGSNLTYAYLKTSYVNGDAGYNIWSNGYCEQWGRTGGASRDQAFNITLLKKMKDGNYFIGGSSTYDQTAGDKGSTWSVQSSAPTGFTIKTRFEQYNGAIVLWKVSGYLATGEY